MNKSIMINFLPLGVTVPRDCKADKLLFNRRIYDNIRVSGSETVDYVTVYHRSISLFINSSTNNTCKTMVDYIFAKAKAYCDENSNVNDKLQIAVYSHCTMNVVVKKFFIDPLKRQISAVSLNSRIKFLIVISDPAEPFEKDKNKKIMDLSKSEELYSENTDTKILFYSAGGGFFCERRGRRNFLNKFVNFTPNVVLGASTIIIDLKDHNDIAAFTKKQFENIMYGEINVYEDGVFIYDGLGFKKVTKDNFKEKIKIISNFTKGKEKQRIKIITNIIALKLKIPTEKLEELVDYIPEYKTELDRVKCRIEKSMNLKNAFKYAIDLFEPKGLFYGFVHKNGEFYRALTEASKYVVGIRNNEHSQAIQVLEKEKQHTKRQYKKELCGALIKRIKKWYNIKN